MILAEHDADIAIENKDKVDMWSFGTVIWELLVKQELYINLSSYQLALKAQADTLAAPLPDDLPPEVEKLLESCFNTNPAQRPTFEQIVKIFFSLRNSQSFKRIGDDEWDQLVSSWNSFAKKMMKEEKEKMDEMVKQESVNDTTSDTYNTLINFIIAILTACIQEDDNDGCSSDGTFYVD
ncbi:unnamed protein product [Enterobius vermicularis]|uniref:Protein kinase domain-containing protein n=1 Tax=Enterobius vermicularis TaxID=51028 RepID=A0A0N4VF23_ENTVE|nr:unnamed protein product [Enterobius vermicularis]